MPKLWMGGVGTLCAIAHYRAALFILLLDILKFFMFLSTMSHDFCFNLDTLSFADTSLYHFDF